MFSSASRQFVLWQRAEGVLVLVASLALFWQIDSGMAWWSAILLFFAPDLSFAAYAAGPRFGAIGYNLVHVYAFGLLVLAAGLVLALPLVASMGALWLAHSGFDRVLGYGLKSSDSFQTTHLGLIGRQKP